MGAQVLKEHQGLKMLGGGNALVSSTSVIIGKNLEHDVTRTSTCQCGVVSSQRLDVERQTQRKAAILWEGRLVSATNCTFPWEVAATVT